MDSFFNVMNEQETSNSTISCPSEIVSYYDSSIVVRRWLATMIDFIILGGIFLVYFLLSFKYLDSIFVNSKTVKNTHYFTVYMYHYVVMFIILVYYPLLEGLAGYTIGKYIAKIRVVDDFYNPPGLLKGIIRTLTRLIEVNPFLLGGIPAGVIVLSSKKRQRLGDMAANTYVLEAKDVTDVFITPMKKIIVKVFISLMFLIFISELLILLL